MKNVYVQRALFISLDFFVAALAVVVSYFMTGGFNGTQKELTIYCAAFVFPSLLVVLNYIFNLYNVLWRYAKLNDFIKLYGAVFFSSCGLYVVHRAVSLHIEPIAIFCIMVITVAFLTLNRFFMRKLAQRQNNQDKSAIVGNVMIVGGGMAGSMIIDDIKSNNYQSNCHIKCIIDDDVQKKGKYISGIKIIGGCEEIISAAEQYKIDLIVFAIPTCPSERKSAILKMCQKTGCEIRTVPSLQQLLSVDTVDTISLRKIEIEDLLGRDPIDIGFDSIIDYVENKVVIVTGGGGSIGSELCRQIALHKPRKLIIFDIYENNAYDIQNELIREYPNLDLVVLIGSVRDMDRLDSVFDKYRPQLVYHAAAHKHVPLMEDSPNESIKNNVFGTLNTVRCADKYGVQKFVLISTDKAVNPTNIMGASKRICEMIVQTYNNHSDTEFVSVRFGNVLGSNGSVIPLFKKQIEEGGPVTVTDPNIIRYFMTIPEAVSLVLQAGACAKGGEIFVLDMGEPVKILDLAENLISLSGYRPYVDIKIDFIGLRPGEKMYEEKLLSEEGLMRTDNRLIHIGHPIEINEDEFLKSLEEMSKIMSDDDCDIRASVKKIVPTYSYNTKTGENVLP